MINSWNIYEIAKATLTPTRFAIQASRGRWKPADHLTLIDRALVNAVLGKGPRRLVITMPPRHGKSELCSHYFPAWYLGTRPDNRIILTSYEAEFAKTWGRKSRDLLEEYGAWFGVSVDRRSSAASYWNFQGRSGGMSTAGVGGPITGKGADLLIVDDPVKNAEDADSPVKREKAWDWWMSTAMSRLEPGGVAVVIQTRWHEDDLAGRILGNKTDPEKWHLINLPAISESGDALWPERWPVSELETIRDRLAASGGTRWWEALYQQRPTPAKGEIFDVSKFRKATRRSIPAKAWEEGTLARYWDRAATADGGDFTAGVLMLYWVDKDAGPYGRPHLWVVDVERGQWSTYERDKRIKTASFGDAVASRNYTAITEQEPGSAGKDSVEHFFRMLAGLRCESDRVTGPKEVRAGGFASAVEAGFVYLCDGDWNQAYIEEHRTFPRGLHDDQVDASSGCYNYLAGSPTQDLEAWIEAGAF